MSTYREELCNKDERGIPVFSPLCQPGRTVDRNLFVGAVGSEISQKVENGYNKSTYGDGNCYIPPVNYPKATPKFDDASTAHDWFQDPTYAQLSAAKNQRITIEIPANLQHYRDQKAAEKAAIAAMQSV